MTYRPLPATVTSELMTLLSWLDWMVLAVCVARLVWVAGQLALRWYRDEAIEGLAGSFTAGILLGAAGLIARELLPER